MGMSDAQFFSHQARELVILRLALEESPNNKYLQILIELKESELKKP